MSDIIVNLVEVTQADGTNISFNLSDLAFIKEDKATGTAIITFKGEMATETICSQDTYEEVSGYLTYMGIRFIPGVDEAFMCDDCNEGECGCDSGDKEDEELN